MQYHAEFNFHRKPSRHRTPWNIAERTGDERVIPVFRRFVELRERLVPYLTEQARTSIDAGLPLMRPLFFTAPHDELVWTRPLQWMLGDDLLVAPVTEQGAKNWPVYLPAGDWVDAWTGETIEGAREITRAAPIDEIPVYLRASAPTGLRRAFEV
jgi:alpha-glucosidase (family GH31 glycosyl hydrolase)